MHLIFLVSKGDGDQNNGEKGKRDLCSHSFQAMKVPIHLFEWLLYAHKILLKKNFGRALEIN